MSRDVGQPPGPPPKRFLRVHRLGLMEHGDSLKIMELFARARRSGQLQDETLLLYSLPPTLTLGQAGKLDQLAATPDALARQGIVVVQEDRPGRAWGLGPTQLIVSLVADLRPHRGDLKRLSQRFGQAVLGSLADFGAKVDLRPDGQLVGGDPARVLGALELSQQRGVSRYGGWLSQGPDLGPVRQVVSLGPEGSGATHLTALLGSGTPSLAQLETAVARRLGQHLGLELRERRPDRKTVSVSILRQRDGKVEALLLFRHPHRGGFWQPVTGTQEKGETPIETARREIGEESGIPNLEPVDLGYRHSFVFEGRSQRGAPRVFEETAFGVRVEGDPQVTLDRREHAEHRWAPLAEALEVVPHLGLRKGLRLSAERLFGPDAVPPLQVRLGPPLGPPQVPAQVPAPASTTPATPAQVPEQAVPVQPGEGSQPK